MGTRGKSTATIGTTASRAGARQGRRLTRLELAETVRERIFKAAAEVVGREGYADAAISKITERAGMAQGTFYLYFESRQALFDELLPHVGQDMIEFVGRRLKGAKDFFDMERRGFQAFFDYLETNPGFFRILNEAEVAAPAGYDAHFENLSRRYIRALERSVASGEIREYAGDQIEALAYMLIAARSYMYLRYVKKAGGRATLPRTVLQTYLKLIRHGIR